MVSQALLSMKGPFTNDALAQIVLSLRIHSWRWAPKHDIAADTQATGAIKLVLCFLCVFAEV